jgi:hypothetical protein
LTKWLHSRKAMPGFFLCIFSSLTSLGHRSQIMEEPVLRQASPILNWHILSLLWQLRGLTQRCEMYQCVCWFGKDSLSMLIWSMLNLHFTSTIMIWGWNVAGKTGKLMIINSIENRKRSGKVCKILYSSSFLQCCTYMHH